MISSSCSSYNTAQLQILSGPEPESLPPPNSEGLLRGVDVGELVVPSIPEHRPSLPATRRNSTSVSTPAIEPSSPVHDVSSRQLQNHPDLSMEGNQSTATGLNIEDDDDEEDEDEVDFWGGESPRERRISALQREEAMNEAEDEEVSSDEDHDMDVDDDDDGDDPEDDRMDIFGHR